MTGKAKTNAERMREYRLRWKEQGARVIVARPEHYRSDSDRELLLTEENHRLTLELDIALKHVADLLDKNKCLSIELKGSQDYVRDLLSTLKSKETSYKSQMTRFSNEKSILDDKLRAAHKRLDRDAPHDLVDIKNQNAHLLKELDLYNDQLRRYMQNAGDDFDKFFFGVLK